MDRLLFYFLSQLLPFSQTNPFGSVHCSLLCICYDVFRFSGRRLLFGRVDFSKEERTFIVGSSLCHCFRFATALINCLRGNLVWLEQAVHNFLSHDTIWSCKSTRSKSWIARKEKKSICKNDSECPAMEFLFTYSVRQSPSIGLTEVVLQPFQFTSSLNRKTWRSFHLFYLSKPAIGLPAVWIHYLGSSPRVVFCAAAVGLVTQRSFKGSFAWRRK